MSKCKALIKQLFSMSIVVVLFYSTSCTYDYNEYDAIPEPDTTNVQPVKFSEDVLPIFQRDCQGCHGAGSWTGIDLSDASAHSALETGGYVDTATPESSALYTILTPDHKGVSLPSTEKVLILNWIKEGALNN